jgi:hypothetical protein
VDACFDLVEFLVRVRVGPRLVRRFHVATMLDIALDSSGELVALGFEFRQFIHCGARHGKARVGIDYVSPTWLKITSRARV